MKSTRRWLYLVLAAGLIALGAGGGTFATFNAQTTNPGNSFATGNLYLADNTSSTTCFSYNGSNNQNTNGTNCAAVLTATNQKPGSNYDSDSVTLTNTGTLPGTLTVYENGCSDYPSVEVNDVTVSSGSPTITVAAPNAFQGVTSGMSVTDLTTGANISSGTTVSSVSGAPTSITLSQNAAASSSGSGDTLLFTSSTANAESTLCGTLQVYLEQGASPSCLSPSGNPNVTFDCTASDSSTDPTLTAFNQYTDPSNTPTAGTPISLGSLAAGANTEVTVGIYFPTTGGNSLMNLASNFSLTFTLTQS